MRTARWLFILFQAVWLVAVLPGHTRGIVPLPGAWAGADDAARAAGLSNGGCCGKPEAGQPSRPLPAGRCAVCHFAAGLFVPVTFTFVQPRPTAVCLLPPTRPERITPRSLPPAYYPCGPPVA